MKVLELQRKSFMNYFHLFEAVSLINKNYCLHCMNVNISLSENNTRHKDSPRILILPSSCHAQGTLMAITFFNSVRGNLILLEN